MPFAARNILEDQELRQAMKSFRYGHERSYLKSYVGFWIVFLISWHGSWEELIETVYHYIDSIKLCMFLFEILCGRLDYVLDFMAQILGRAY